MIRLPENYTEIEASFCSNFDHMINRDVVKRLKENDVFANYPAWDWHGSVWFDKQEEKFCCAVKQYGVHKATLVADNPDEIKEKLCDDYGYE